MISHIEGKLIEKTPTYAIIECGGIGFLMNITLNTFSVLGNVGETCKLFTHLAFKNEATTPVGLSLYGFSSQDERSAYIELISVSGVGNNTARLILSSLTTSEVVSAIINNNVGVFQKVKGIGGKTAQKIIIDLKDRIGKNISANPTSISAMSSSKDEAMSALIILGFAKPLAEKALDRIIKAESNLSVEQLIKSALKIL